MNFKKQAEKLEKFLEEEFSKKLPLIVLKDNSLVYKRFKIKQNKQKNWELKHITGDVIDIFKLKATAALGAKYYNCNEFEIYNRIKDLDTKYWTNSVDSFIFKQRYTNAKDQGKKITYLSRYEITSHRAKQYKDEITRMFKNSF